MQAIFVANVIYKSYKTHQWHQSILGPQNKDFHKVKVNTIIWVYAGHSPIHPGVDTCYIYHFVSTNNIFTILFFNTNYYKQINKIIIAAFNETLESSVPQNQS